MIMRSIDYHIYDQKEYGSVTVLRLKSLTLGLEDYQKQGHEA